MFDQELAAELINKVRSHSYNHEGAEQLLIELADMLDAATALVTRPPTGPGVMIAFTKLAPDERACVLADMVDYSVPSRMASPSR